MIRKKAFITGITGQDGSYLTELLLSKGYEVHGMIRRSSSFNTGRIDHLYHDLHENGVPLILHYGDLADGARLHSLLHREKPDEIYNLGAQSHVQVSFDMPEYTAESVAIGTIRLLETIRHVSWPVRYYQAGSSEMFGQVLETPQRETTPFNPRSPYAAAKVFAHHMTVNYRDAYGIFASNGILFNHESPRRGATFVTRKITRGIASILAGETDSLYMGNLDAQRDWGYAPEYVDAMWRILQHDEPGDFVVATGEAHSVKQFVKHAFDIVGLDWQDHIKVDERYFRPTEVDLLVGDATRARTELGWQSRRTLRDLICIMLAHDLRRAGIDTTRYQDLANVPPDAQPIQLLSRFSEDAA